MIKLLVSIMVMVGLCFSVSAHADLMDNGNGLVYDTDLDITWHVPTNGSMTWNEAMLWAENLTIGLATSWRLPSAVNFDGSYPDYEYNIVTNEPGYLYYVELGNSPHGPLTNAGPFENLYQENYWTSTTTLNFSDNAFVFSFKNGRQGHADKDLDLNYHAMAVHAGNVTSHTPIPASVFLCAPAIIGLATLRKRLVK